MKSFILTLVVVLFLLEAYSLYTNKTLSEPYRFCTQGSCYTLVNNNYDGVENCRVYPPPAKPVDECDAPATIPFADWKPSACAGIYTTVLDGAENRQKLCGTIGQPCPGGCGGCV